MRLRIIAPIALLLLAMLSTARTPAHGQLTLASDDDPVLAGRNCGGTLLVEGPFGPIAAQTGLNGWSIGGAIDPAASALSQVAPAVAISSTGTPLYAWQEATSRDSGDIIAADGEAALSQGRRGVRVDDTANAAVVQSAPALAITNDGVAFAVWQDRRDSPNADRLFFSRSPDGGQTWPANALVHNLSRVYQNHRAPALLADKAGGMHLLYVAEGFSRKDIRYARYDGAGWSAANTVNTSVVNIARGRPTMALASDGDLLAAWEDSRSGVKQIFVARLDMSGGALAWGSDVLATPANLAVGRPSLAVAADGTIYLAYQRALSSGAGIYVVVSTDGGQNWSQPQRVDDNSGTATNPRIAVDSRGGVHCIWCRLSGTAGILTARSANGGLNWPAPTVLASTTGTAEPMALAADDAGHVYAAWSDSPNDISPILYAAEWSDKQQLYLPLLRSR